MISLMWLSIYLPVHSVFAFIHTEAMFFFQFSSGAGQSCIVVRKEKVLTCACFIYNVDEFVSRALPAFK